MNKGNEQIDTLLSLSDDGFSLGCFLSCGMVGTEGIGAGGNAATIGGMAGTGIGVGIDRGMGTIAVAPSGSSLFKQIKLNIYNLTFPSIIITTL